MTTNRPTYLYVNQNGRIVCARRAHAGTYLADAIARRPRAEIIDTPLDNWVRVTPADLGDWPGLGCEHCKAEHAVEAVLGRPLEPGDDSILDGAADEMVAAFVDDLRIWMSEEQSIDVPDEWMPELTQMARPFLPDLHYRDYGYVDAVYEAYAAFFEHYWPSNEPPAVLSADLGGAA